MSTRDYVDARELAERLGVTRDTVYRWRREGRLAGLLVRTPGGRLRIARADLPLVVTAAETGRIAEADRGR